MPRLILRADQVAEWPTVRECVIVRTGTTQGYTQFGAAQRQHPLPGHPLLHRPAQHQQ